MPQANDFTLARRQGGKGVIQLFALLFLLLMFSIMLFRGRAGIAQGVFQGRFFVVGWRRKGKIRHLSGEKVEET
ncbi:MAG: hypothetical protein A2018_02895 [Alphaproteobacteria bacterium GWF2_58_20]|nr:MAG: hypothetical protein A2018_02895 [Alphaproteobacteria bacterium GWF2_58_20]